MPVGLIFYYRKSWPFMCDLWDQILLEPLCI